MPADSQTRTANATEFLDAAYDGADAGGGDSQAAQAEPAKKELDSGREPAEGAAEGDGGHETADAAGRQEEAGEQRQVDETLTRSAFDQAMKQATSEQARFFKEQLEQITNRHEAQMRSLRTQFQAHRQRQTAQPSKPILMPIADWLERGGSRETYEILSGIIEQQEKRFTDLQGRVDNFHQTSRVNELSNKIERHLTTSIDDVYKEFPEIAKKEKLRDLLEGSVIAHMTAVANSGKDTTKYDIRGLARGVAKEIMEIANAQSEAQRQKALGPKGGASAKGSPTRPVKPEGDFKNTRDFLDRGIGGAADELARAFGMDDES